MIQSSSVFSSYSVDDIDVAKSFYEDILGCTVRHDDMGLYLDFVNGHQVFIYQKEDHAPADFTVLNFVVPSIDESISTLSEHGVVTERYDTLPTAQDETGVLRGKAADMGPDIAWITDPAHNVIAIIEN